MWPGKWSRIELAKIARMLVILKGRKLRMPIALRGLKRRSNNVTIGISLQ
jgi:hypothetical protein